jgi:hypothetical protein
LGAKLQQNYEQIYFFAQKINAKEVHFTTKTNKLCFTVLKKKDICKRKLFFMAKFLNLKQNIFWQTVCSYLKI